MNTADHQPDTATNDPCADLRTDLEIAIEEHKDARSEVLIRAFLGVIGFEWVYDLVRGRGINWTVFIDLLRLLDFTAALTWLVTLLGEVGLAGAAARIVATIGPWTLGLLAVSLAIEIGIAISRWNEIDECFVHRLRELYEQSACPDKDAVFRDLGLEIPR